MTLSGDRRGRDHLVPAQWGRKRPGGLGDLQNRSDLPTAGWVGSIPTRSRHRGRRCSASPSRRVLRLVVSIIAALSVSSPIAAQQQDSARAGISRTTPPALAPERAVRTDAVPQPATRRARPPVSPKAAFLYSLVLPGYGQAKLDRSYAGALFFSVEAFAFSMLRQAEIDLHYAQAHLRDSTRVVQTYQTDSLGQSVRDSTGRPIPATYAYARYDSLRVAARKTHVEDWIAVLLFNHLISGADAFVAAQLWDLPAHVHPMFGESADGKRRLYGASISW